jgi:hypothetical protein
MSTEALTSFITKISEDADLQGRYRTDPDAVLSEFDLTAEEREAARTEDPVRLQALGVEERIAKVAPVNYCAGM